MSADSIYSDDWNSSLTGSQMNAWNLEDDINRIGSKAEDFLSGIWSAQSCVSETGPKWKAKSDDDDSNPFRRFQTSPPNRISPTPLADLYSQSIDQAEINSESWGATEHVEYNDSVMEEDCSQNLNEVEFMPQDLFSFSQAPSIKIGDAPLLATEGALEGDAPQLLVETKNVERQVKCPLLSLSVGMSICGVGLVFGSQIMHNPTLVNPGKSLIIAGLIGLFVSVVFQTFKWFGRRKTA